MKKNDFFLSLMILLFVMILISCGEQKQGSNKILLPEIWKFQPGDNLLYSAEDFNDSRWTQIKVGQVWDIQGYKDLDNYAWYRVVFNLPSSIKSVSYLKDSVKIYLGKIDDFDEIYLNGEILGYNGITLPAGSVTPDRFNEEPSSWYLERNYVISSDDSRLHWDKENVIAVRVWDRGGLGGMYYGSPVIGMMDVGDYLKFDHLVSTFSFKTERPLKDLKLGILQEKYKWKVRLVFLPLMILQEKKFTRKKSQLLYPSVAKAK